MILDIFRFPEEQELTERDLQKFIKLNDAKTQSRYQIMWDAYNNDYEILHAAKKEEGKPDNRIVVNKARYLTDTFEGFHLGIPVKISSDDERVSEYINALEDNYNGTDINAELSTIVSIYGRGYRIAYVDDDGEIGSAYLDPMESFAIYNEGIKPRMLYFVRLYSGYDKKRYGSISDATTVRYFHIAGGIVWDEEFAHGFNGVPAVEFIMNEARRGIFEDALSMMNAYNKGLSEKANDADYYGDAYMLVKGPDVTTDDAKVIHDKRLINLVTTGMPQGADADARFLDKLSDDDTQEHLLDRLDKEIYITSMSCQTDEEKFGSSSGIALKHKLNAMASLSNKKWGKMEASLKQYYKLICSNPVSPLGEDDWKSLVFTHTMNYPTNMTEEADAASKLDGIISRKTQLSMLSVVKDVDAEIAQIEAEEQTDEDYKTDYSTDRTANDAAETDAEDAEE